MTKIFGVVNQKGGVGKTTTVVNLGAALAEQGYKVLVVDMDPQGHCSSGLGVDSTKAEATSADVILDGVEASRAYHPTSQDALRILPASVELAAAETRLANALARENRLKRALAEIRKDFDYVLIDSPPSLGLLTINCLAAAEALLVPVQAEYYALEGLARLEELVREVKATINPGLELGGLVLTMFDPRPRLAQEVAEQIRQHFGSLLFETFIPRNIRLAEAPSYGLPINKYDPHCTGALAYRRLAQELLVRNSAQRLKAVEEECEMEIASTRSEDERKEEKLQIANERGVETG